MRTKYSYNSVNNIARCTRYDLSYMIQDILVLRIPYDQESSVTYDWRHIHI